MVLILDLDKLQGIRDHAEQTYPEECCGLLVGWITASAKGDEVRQVVRCVPADNAWDETVAAEVNPLQRISVAERPTTKDNRYWIDPQLMLRVQREAREGTGTDSAGHRHLDIIGTYHSHPDHLALPSECDRTLAWPSYSYIIVSVIQGQAVDLRCWCLDGAHQFQPEVMRMEAQPPHTPHPPTPML